MRKYILFFALALAGCTGISLAQSAIDSSLLYHPEKHFWYPNSMPYVYFNRSVSLQRNVVWATAHHTAQFVPLGCVGPKKYTTQLKGIKHNTNTANVIKQAVKDGINIILVIGDGMGSVHMSLPIFMNIAKENNQQTMFERIMNEGDCGYQITSLADGLVTGSAAAGTALATGSKTRMGMVGVDSTGMVLENTFEVAKQYGYKTAIVTDASVTDATPAAHYGHAVYRYMQSGLAEQLVNNNNVDIAFGGGASFFIPQNTDLKSYEAFKGSSAKGTSSRTDTVNLITQINNNGYKLISTKQALEQENSSRVIGLFAGGGLPAPIDLKNAKAAQEPTLTEMANRALHLVSKSSLHYVAMIESARIDWEAHANDAGAVLQAVNEMDKVLQTAYSYYEDDPEGTLLIFTADHETGGLAIAYEKLDKKYEEKKVFPDGSTWVNNTDPLLFNEYEKLENQDKSLSEIFKGAKNYKSLQKLIEQHTGYRISEAQSQQIMQSIIDLDVLKMKK
ncbi:alkaline phosphatase [Saccharicrinis aurantiacus]|uniref:alkaline phosphatase n=1 Tax=Saccharicrinis aurantiacus TaxID=1849719 RepID=UPI0008392AAA|nr:alkaline phosphatase [Saccharicrinis aurantiacus]